MNNQFTAEDIKEYVSKNPTGIAGKSKELSDMVNYFVGLAWKEAYESGYDKGMSDCMDGQGGV